MKRCSEKGFTLVEVIVASTIFVIATATIASTLMDITRKNFHTNRHTQATILANNKLEELLNAGYENPLLAEGEYENQLNPVNATGDSSGRFYLYWAVDDHTPIPTSKRIVSQVVWDGADGEEKIVTLTTLCIETIN